MNQLFARDEREAGVDRAADRIAYLVLSYGLLAIVAWRSFVDRQASWELLALVVLGGLAGAAYRLRARVLTRESLIVIGITIAAAAVVGGVIAIGLRAA
jgi:hypothetical protein